MKTQEATSIELENVTVSLIEDGIIENFIHPGKTADVKDAWQVKKLNMNIAGSKPYAVIIVSGHLSNVSKSAREVVASKEFVGNTVAKAILVDSLGQRLVGNFYLTVNRPFIKTKIFNDRSEAIKWLRMQLKS